jgi:enoyl-CoA hydratase
MFKIGLNEVAIGLPVPVLAMELARDRLAPTELARATLMAQIYAPEQAVPAGWLDEVVPPDRVIARATEEAARLGALSKPAFRQTKRRLRGRTIELIRTTSGDDLRSLTIPSG